MATKAWKCLKCGEMNDPNEEFREVASNTCANCKTWRYLFYALGTGGLGVLVVLGLLVTTLLGMPARQYKQAFLRYLESGQQIDEQEREELSKLAQKYNLDAVTVAKLENEAGRVNPDSGSTVVETKPSQPVQPTAIATNKQMSGQAKRELIALLHDIYSDNLKTQVEQDALNKALQEEGNLAAELPGLEQQVREQCEKSRPYIEQALFFVKQNKFSEALDAFERALKVDGDNAWIRANMGSAYLRNAQSEKATLSFKQALELNPKNWLAHYNLGSIYAKQGQKDEAIDELTQAVQIVVEDRNQRMTRANLIQQLRVDATFKPIQEDARFQQLLNQN